MIYILSDYFVIETRRINIVLRQDYEYVLLFIEYEHGLFLKQEFLLGTEKMCLED